MLKTIKKAAFQAVQPPRGLSGPDYFYTYSYQLLRLALGGLFVYAGLIKLLDPTAFAHSIAQYDLAPEAFLPWLAIGLPALELLAGLGLILEGRGSLSAIAILLAFFLLALSYAVWMEMDIDCGCFTVEEANAKTGVQTALLRDLFMAAVVVYLYWWRWRGPRQNPANKNSNRLK